MLKKFASSAPKLTANMQFSMRNYRRTDRKYTKGSKKDSQGSNPFFSNLRKRGPKIAITAAILFVGLQQYNAYKQKYKDTIDMINDAYQFPEKVADFIRKALQGIEFTQKQMPQGYLNASGQKEIVVQELTDGNVRIIFTVKDQLSAVELDKKSGDEFLHNLKLIRHPSLKIVPIAFGVITGAATFFTCMTVVPDFVKWTSPTVFALTTAGCGALGVVSGLTVHNLANETLKWFENVAVESLIKKNSQRLSANMKEAKQMDIY